MEKIGKFEVSVPQGRTDRDGGPSLCGLCGVLLDCAGRHAESRGFGLALLNERQYTWVLSRLAVEVYDLPAAGEGCTVLTWVENICRQFTGRCFEVQDGRGQVLAYARSIWAMLDFRSRKSADLGELYGGKIEDYVSDRACPIARPGHFRLSAPVWLAEAPVRPEDIDSNGHLHSLSYIAQVLDLFSPEEAAGKSVRRLEAAYLRETLSGDRLAFYRQRSGDRDLVEVRNRHGEPVCGVALQWVPSHCD